jgi:hypothetical protein
MWIRGTERRALDVATRSSAATSRRYRRAASLPSRLRSWTRCLC